MLLAKRRQVLLVDLAFILNLFQIDILPVELRRVKLVNPLFALQDQRFFARIESLVLHRLLNDVRLAALQKAREQINR